MYLVPGQFLTFTFRTPFIGTFYQVSIFSSLLNFWKLSWILSHKLYRKVKVGNDQEMSKSDRKKYVFIFKFG